MLILIFHFLILFSGDSASFNNTETDASQNIYLTGNQGGWFITLYEDHRFFCRSTHYLNEFYGFWKKNDDFTLTLVTDNIEYDFPYPDESNIINTQLYKCIFKLHQDHYKLITVYSYDGKKWEKVILRKFEPDLGLGNDYDFFEKNMQFKIVNYDEYAEFSR